MTNQQYKNIVDWTLKNLDAAARDDSLSVARAVLNNCGVSLPEGGLPEILDALQSGDYMWWKSCTCEEARSFADEGQPVVGVDGGRLVVIVPSDTASGETAANGETAADERRGRRSCRDGRIRRRGRDRIEFCDCRSRCGFRKPFRAFRRSADRGTAYRHAVLCLRRQHLDKHDHHDCSADRTVDGRRTSESECDADWKQNRYYDICR